MKKYIILIAGLLLLLSGCQAQEQDIINDATKSNELKNNEQTNEKEETATPEPSNALTVEAYEMSFTLDHKTVKKGEVITATITNTGKVFHDWVFMDMPVEIISSPDANGNDHHGDKTVDEGDGHHDESSTEHNDGNDGHHGDENSADHNDDNDGHHNNDNSHGGTMHVNVDPGESVQIQFTATEAGTYKFFCSVPGHEAAGMVGELTVID
jgi:uncharacterized cupredoxin-like copper-binding protein